MPTLAISLAKITLRTLKVFICNRQVTPLLSTKKLLHLFRSVLFKFIVRIASVKIISKI